ncbi:MAG: pilus assembly protein FimV [Gammaproteobacteria bacterium]
MRTNMSLINLRTLVLALTAPLLVPNAYALSVGEMSVDSHLGEPLALSIPLSTDSQNELDSFKSKLAPRAAFDESGVPYPLEAEAIQFTIDDKDGSPVLRVYTLNALDTPYLHLLMQLSWSGGNMLREYVALIDPAEYGNDAKATAMAGGTLEGASGQVLQAGDWVTVDWGDTVSEIAQRFKPSDVFAQQAWMAFFNLNQAAFPANNIDLLVTGVKLKIPTREQMLALSQSSAIAKVRSVSPKTKATEQPAAIGAVAQATTMQNVLTIGASASEAATTSGSNGLNSAVVEQLLEAKLGEMVSIKADVTKFSEELVAVRGENQVVAKRLSQVETQLGKISQLLELQSQTLGTLIEQALLHKQAMQDAQSLSAQLKESQQLESQQLELQQLKALQALALQQNVGSIPTASQSFNSALNSIGGATDEQVNVAVTDTNLDTVASQAFQSESAASSTSVDEASITGSQRKARIAELEAALQTKISEAPKKQGSDTSLGGQNASDWKGAVVSAKNKIAASFKVDTDKLTEGSFVSSLMGLVSQWGLYILGGVLALIGLGTFMRRRVDREESADDGADSESEIEDLSAMKLTDDSIDIDLSGQVSSIFSFSEDSEIQTDDAPSEPLLGGESSLFAMDGQDSMMDRIDMESEAMTQQSTIGQVTDVDPLTEAEVYLAYDRKEQAIKVLKDAYADNPKEQEIAIKLLSLHEESDDQEAFGRVLETAYANKDENADGDQWLKIKTMGKAFSPTHPLFLDNDFHSSIPVLRDEIESDDDIEEEAIDEANADDELEPVSIDSFTLDLESELSATLKEANQHDPDTSLALAKAYIELGEAKIAKDFLKDVISAGSNNLKLEAKKLLKSIKN